MQTRAIPRVGKLIVVLDEVDERRGRDTVGTRAARLLLPRVALTLEQEPALPCRDQLLRRPAVVRVVRLPASGDAAIAL